VAKLVKPFAGLALLGALSLLVGWRPLLDTFALASRNDQYTYMLLIAPLSAALVFLEWRLVLPLRSRGVRTGLALLAAAALMACFVQVSSGWWPSDTTLTMRMFALVLWWIGAFVLCFGSRAAEAVSFPLLFLFGLVPLPQPAIDVVVAILQHGSAWAAHLLFAVCGVPVAQDGVLLTIPGLTLQVAQECSSIRSSSMLLVTTMVLAQLVLRSPWRKALLIGLAVPLSVAKNALRIFAIAMLGTRVDPVFITGRFHHQGGIIFFAIALVVLFALLWILRRGESRPPASGPNPATAAATEA